MKQKTNPTTNNNDNRTTNSSNKKYTSYLLIDANTNKKFQLFYESELGFLVVTLFFDMLLEPFIMHFEMKYEQKSLAREVFFIILISFSLICLPLVVLSYYAIRRKSKIYILVCLLAQLGFILIVVIKSIGLLCNYLPYFCMEKWITVMHFCFQLIIPLFSSALIVGVYLNENIFLDNNNTNNNNNNINIHILT
jgi:hypothetical protein